MDFRLFTLTRTHGVAVLVASSALLSAACGAEAPQPTATSTTSTPAAATAAATMAAATATPTAAAAAISITGGWARSTPGNPNENSAAYATVTNGAKEADRLVSASVGAKVAAKVELHRTVRTGDQMKMEPVPYFEIAANGGTLTLEPGGNHIMLLNLPTALRAGTKVPITLQFERGGTKTMDFEVREATGTSSGMGGTSGMGMGGR